MNIKTLLVAFALALLVTAGVFSFSHAPIAVLEPAREMPKPVSLLFVGDIMMDRGVRGSINKNFGGDYSKLFENTAYLKDADITFGNLEGPVGTSGRKVGSRFSFLMEPQSLVAMKNAGFDVVSFSNNHVGDYSLTAFNESLTLMQQEGILYAGAGESYADATQPRIIDVRGMKIGFLAATDVGPNWMEASETRAGILIASDPNLEKIITDAKALVDILIMSYHWGDEYSPVNIRQEKLAKLSIDAGADIIVGHHPHVMQRFEYYNGKPIFYSLGNFIFDQYFSPFTMHGMVGKATIDPETKNISIAADISPLNDNYIPIAPFPFEEKFLLTKRFTP